MSDLSNTLSADSHGRTSDTVAFRNSNTLNPISVTATRQVIPASAWRNSLLVENKGTDIIYWGDVTVTSTNGMSIGVGAKAEFQFGSGNDIYVVCAAGLTSTLNGVEVG